MIVYTQQHGQVIISAVTATRIERFLVKPIPSSLKASLDKTLHNAYLDLMKDVP